MSDTPQDSHKPSGGEATLELSSNRTALSFERTLLSADRTLMSSMRTALSLISFGFTIAQLFARLRKAGEVAVGAHAARNFGLALIVLGVGILAAGIAYHWQFQRSLMSRREGLFEQQLLRHPAHYKRTPTFIAAILLILIGIFAALSLVFRALGAA